MTMTSEKRSRHSGDNQLRPAYVIVLALLGLCPVLLGSCAHLSPHLDYKDTSDAFASACRRHSRLPSLQATQNMSIKEDKFVPVGRTTERGRKLEWLSCGRTLALILFPVEQRPVLGSESLGPITQGLTLGPAARPTTRRSPSLVTTCCLEGKLHKPGSHYASWSRYCGTASNVHSWGQNCTEMRPRDLQ